MRQSEINSNYERQQQQQKKNFTTNIVVKFTFNNKNLKVYFQILKVRFLNLTSTDLINQPHGTRENSIMVVRHQTFSLGIYFLEHLGSFSITHTQDL